MLDITHYYTVEIIDKYMLTFFFTISPQILAKWNDSDCEQSALFPISMGSVRKHSQHECSVTAEFDWKLGGTMMNVRTRLVISSFGCDLLPAPFKAGVWSAVLRGSSTWQTGALLWVTVSSVCLWQRLSSLSALKLALKPIGNGSFIIHLS